MMQAAKHVASIRRERHLARHGPLFGCNVLISAASVSGKPEETEKQFLVL